MKCEAVLLVLCMVSWGDCSRLLRQIEGEASTLAETDASEPCCYPRPPKSRNFKRCCQIPMEVIFKNFEADREACREEMKKKHEEELASLTTTTTTTTPSPISLEKEEADLDTMGEEIEDHDEMSSETQATRSGKSHGCNKHKHFHHKRGKSKCLVKTMEQHGWSNNGTINWSAVIQEIDTGRGEIALRWASVMKESAANCSKQLNTEVTEGLENNQVRNHNRWHVPEKAAMRCMKNNAIMNCPDFPEDDEYCVKLREVYQRCGARKQPGKKRLPWCEPKNKQRKHFMKKQK